MFLVNKINPWIIKRNKNTWPYSLKEFDVEKNYKGTSLLLEKVEEMENSLAGFMQVLI